MSMLAGLRALLRGANTSQPPAVTVVAALPVAKPDAGNELAARAAFDAGKTAFRAKDYAAAVACFSTVVDLRHDDADAHNSLGLSYLEQEMREDAADCFLLALHYRPGFPQALYNLALVAQQRGDFDEAVACLEQAIALMPDYAAAHNNLGYVLCRELGDFERGAEHIRAALRLVPDDPDALCNYSMVLIQEGRSEEALAICDRQLAANPGLHEARLNRALAMLKLGRFAEAWPDYEARKITHSNYAPRSLPLPEWRGQVLRDKRLLVYAEQGLGDQIMFASCLPDLLDRVGGCVIECAPRLVPIFRRSFPAARIEPQARDDASLASLVQAARLDYQVAIGSLPGFFRRDLSDFPRHNGYLRADAARVAYWKDRLGALGTGLKVGISWFGGAVSTRRDARSTQLQDWFPVLSQASCSFVSLQYGDVSGELETVSRENQVNIHCWSAAIDDYDETAALVGALDLVISVQTAVVHLAGALGKPAWVLVPSVPEWRYLNSGDAMPWYSSVRLFRQQQAREWQPVIAEVAVELARRMQPDPNRIVPATELWARGLAQWECGDLTAAADHLGRAIAAHPDRADWRNELGLLWLKAGAPERAAGEFEAALAIDPGLAQAHCNLGIVARQRGDTRLALVSFERARELNPILLEAHFNCGLLLREIDLPDQAVACFERTLELDPGYVEAHRSLACALQDLGRFDAARVSFECALAIRPDHHEARLSKAFLHLLCGEFREGWLDYAARFATEESPLRPFPFPDWDGGSLEGKTLLVYAEQGLGDEILFAGCVPDLIAKARHVVIDCEPRLAALFARSFPPATVHGGVRDADQQWLNGVPTPDLKVAAGSVPGFLRNAPVDFPARDHYLLADPARVDHWRHRLASLGPGLKVGIAWRGGLPQTRAARRSLALADLLPILSDPGCRFVSLQYTDCAAEIKALLQSAGVRVHNWQEAIDDYDETAALVTALDLVISVQTAVVHLAGALGKPAWVLVPAVAEWRYLQSGDSMPWYSSLRLFRRQRANGWESVIAAVSVELAKLRQT